MNTNMFETYYNYKKKTLFEYSLLLSKILDISKNKMWHSNRIKEDSLKKIIDIYFDKYEINHNNDSNLVRCFINNKDIFKYKIDREIIAVIDYFTVNTRAFEIKAYEKEIILVGIILNIANNLDISTVPFKENKNNYKTILINYIEKFNKIDFINIIDDGKRNINVLLELIKTNVRKERKLFESLTSNISFNRYIDISKGNYLAQYNYSVPMINKYDKAAINYVYNKDNINDDFALISYDLISVTLMKTFSVRDTKETYYLPLKREFFKTDKNVRGLNTLFKNNYLKRHIKILINYNDFDENLLKIFNKYKYYDYYIYCSAYTDIKDNKLIEKVNNYIFNNDFINQNKNKLKLFINKNIIYEKYIGMFIDKDILLRKKDINE